MLDAPHVPCRQCGADSVSGLCWLCQRTDTAAIPKPHRKCVRCGEASFVRMCWSCETLLVRKPKQVGKFQKAAP